MNNPAAAFEFDEVGEWSRVKLEIIEKYGSAYTRAFANHSYIKKYYIDGFSGAGVHLVKKTREQIEGSPSIALRTKPPFDGFYFIDMNADKTAHLRTLCAGHANAHVHTGDTNTYLRELLPKIIKYDEYKRALCLLDPYGLSLDWDVIALAGQSGAVDLLLNFPVMDMNRNAVWRMQDKAPQWGIDRMNRFWGDETWRQAAYAENPQANLFSSVPEMQKLGNEAIVTAFRERLQTVARFEFVPEPLPMRNSRNAVVYYLFFASSKPVARNIITDIFKSHR